MHINLILIPFIILMGLFLPDNDKNRKIYIIVVILIFSLESALRSLFLVEDTYRYYIHFVEKVPEISWGEIWSSFIGRYFGEGEREYDFGYTLLEKALRCVTSSFQVFTFLSQLLFYVPMGILLYKYSTNNRQLIFAFIFFIALLQVSALGGGRQLLARGCWLMTFMLVDEKKYVKAALWLLVGATFHFSIFIVLAAVALGFLKPGQLKLGHAITFFVLPLVLLSPRAIISFMGAVIESERYAGYGEHEITGGATTFVVLMELLSVFCFIMLRKSSLDENKSLKKMYAMLPCLTLAAPLIIADGVMIRLSSYFHMFLMLLVPLAIDEFKDKKTIILIYVLLISTLAFLTVKNGGGLEYYFFWQD